MAENSKKSDNKSTTEEAQQQKRCFVIMPFSDPEGYAPGHFRKVYDQIIKPAVENAGYVAYRVDENGVSDLITTKIFKAILDCEMAVCDLSSRNPNVLYELGIRHSFDKPVVLITDDKTERIFDIQGLSTITYRSSRLYDEVPEDQEKISKAIKANENNSSTYSIINMVKLQGAVYDKDYRNVNSPEFYNAILMRVVAALEKIEQNQAAFYPKSRNEYSKIEYDISKIDDRMAELSFIIRDAIENNEQINTIKISYEINYLLDINNYNLNSSFINDKQREYLHIQNNYLKQLLDNLRLLENKITLH